MRIAMWSGPRNLSTAMMYAFANRPDFAVWDEPFYAPYLSATGEDHPMANEIIATHEADPISVAARCVGAIPDEKQHLYMKHMPHHMCPEFPLDWARQCINVHLIRHPARVIASYGKKRAEITEHDIGFAAQAAIYNKLGGIVIDSADIRANPKALLSRLCKLIDLPFDNAMLAWPSGPRSFDGIWARHWYGQVHKSTGFLDAEGPLPELDAAQKRLCEYAMPHFENMKSHAI